MKKSYIRIRCSEQDKAMIAAMAEQGGMSMGEYLLDLVNNDKQCYHEVEVFAVARGTNKANTETIEKGRKSLGKVLVDDYNRASVYTTYERLMKEAYALFGKMAERCNHYFYLEVDGVKVEPPHPFSDWVILGKRVEEKKN